MGHFNEELTALSYRVRLLRMGNTGTGATAGDGCSEGSAEIVDCCYKFSISIHQMNFKQNQFNVHTYILSSHITTISATGP